MKLRSLCLTTTLALGILATDSSAKATSALDVKPRLRNTPVSSLSQDSGTKMKIMSKKILKINTIRCDNINILLAIYDTCSHLLLSNKIKGMLNNLKDTHVHYLKVIPFVDSSSGLKEDCLIIKNLFLINKITPSSQKGIGRKINPKTGVPSHLVNIISNWNNFHLGDKIVLMTYLRSYRYLDWLFEPNFKTIEQDLTPDQWIKVYALCANIKKRFKLRGKDARVFKDIKFSTKMDPTDYLVLGRFSSRGGSSVGPFGTGLTAIILSVFGYFGKDYEKSILDNFLVNYQKDHRFVTFNQGKLVRGLLRVLDVTSDKISLFLSFLPKKYCNGYMGPNRTLTWFSDGIGKARYIAIADWFTQSVLAPYHHLQISLLKTLERDYTFDQNKCISTLKKWYLIGIKDVYSFDLSAATDRIPIVLQATVLNILGSSKDTVESGMKIMVELPFHTRTGKLIRYRVGQGIGIYSSGSSIALTHHVLVKYAASTVGQTNFWKYIILGDDVVIANSEVALAYKNIIEDLRMEISITKSVLPRNGLVAAEFASKGVLNGINVSPLPVGLSLQKDSISRLSFTKAVHQSFLEVQMILSDAKEQMITLQVSDVFPGSRNRETIPPTFRWVLTFDNHILFGTWLSNLYLCKKVGRECFLSLYVIGLLYINFTNKIDELKEYPHGGALSGALSNFLPGGLLLDEVVVEFYNSTPLTVGVRLGENEKSYLLTRLIRVVKLRDEYTFNPKALLKHGNQQLGLPKPLIDFFSDLENEGLLIFIITPWLTAATKIYKIVLINIIEKFDLYKRSFSDFKYHKSYKLQDLITLPGLIRILGIEEIEIILLLSQGPISGLKKSSLIIPKASLKVMQRTGKIRQEIMKTGRSDIFIKSVRKLGIIDLPVKSAFSKKVISPKIKEFKS